MSETIVLDPSAVATGRTEFDITGLIQAAGVDWGDAAIEAYMAEATRGQVPVDFRIPNRTITIPLVMKNISGVTYDQARQKMQAKVGLIHREGGWLKRVVKGTPLYADVVNATLKLGGSGLQALRDFDIDATLTLECLPEFYGDEITLDNMTETTATELVQVLKLSASNAVIKGDYPARTRIVVDDDSGNSQRGLIWGLRSRYYDSATTAALAYQAEQLTYLDAAVASSTGSIGASASTNVTGSATTTSGTPTLTGVTNTGAWRNGMTITGTGIGASAVIVSGAGTSTMTLSVNSSGSATVTITGAYNVVAHTSLQTDWTPVLRTDLYGTGALTHKGSYRVWARVWTLSGVSTWATPAPTRPRLRFVWDVGDLTMPVTNDPITVPSVTGMVDVDLGGIRLDAPPVGTHKWFGMVQAKGGVAGQSIYIDKIWFVPTDEGYGALRSGVPNGQDLAAFTARDGFDQTAGALAGKTLPIGGTWAGAGDADDFSVNATSHTAQRTATADTNGDMNNGRWAIAGSSVLTNTYVQVSMASTTTDTSWGVFARYTDINNWVAARVSPSTIVGGVPITIINVVSAVAGVLTGFDEYDYPGVVMPANTNCTLRMYVDESGMVRVWFYPGAAVDSSPPVIEAQIADLATGGTLDDGKVGFWNHHTAGAATRTFDDFLAWAPTSDAVIYASQSAELRFDGMYREDATGTSYGPVSSVIGDLPRLPPSGIENRPVELFLKATRGDLDDLTDSGIDDISAQVFYRPCFLFVPS